METPTLTNNDASYVKLSYNYVWVDGEILHCKCFNETMGKEEENEIVFMEFDIHVKKEFWNSFLFLHSNLLISCEVCNNYVYLIDD